jgi:hypothetical protein
VNMNPDAARMAHHRAQAKLRKHFLGGG